MPFTLLFLIYKQGNTWGGIFYNIIIGEGHIWFLPMLFLCFVGIYLFELLKFPPKIVIVLAIIASLFSLGPLADLPFRISQAMYYFLFFVIGYYLQKFNVSIERLARAKSITLLLVVYLITFLLYQHLLLKHLNIGTTELSTLTRFANSFLRRSLRITQAIGGLFMSLSLVNYMLNNNLIHVSSLAIKLSGYCFGVYVFQQFILKWIITNPYMINALGSIYLPWVAFLLASMLSLFMTHIMLKTKFGRFLVG